MAQPLDNAAIAAYIAAELEEKQQAEETTIGGVPKTLLFGLVAVILVLIIIALAVKFG